MYADRDILVLDEATNSLDSKTKYKIIKKLFHLKNKTIIIIAHNIKLYEICDYIYVLNNGKIENHGTYNDIKKNNVIFKSLNLLDDMEKY